MQWSVQEEAYSDQQMKVYVLAKWQKQFSFQFVFFTASHLPAHPSARKATFRKRDTFYFFKKRISDPPQKKGQTI